MDDVVPQGDRNSTLNPVAVTAWRGRLEAARAVLNSPSLAREKKAQRVLAEAVSALAAALERLDRASAESHKAGLRADAEHRRYSSLFEDLPIAAITTERWGEIVDLNPVAEGLLNLSARHASGRSLLLFFDERPEWMALCRTLENHEAQVRAVTMRPRERAPQRLVAHVRLADDHEVRWFLLPGGE